MIVGIVGGGFCGSATALMFSHIQTKTYDVDVSRCSQGVTSLNDLDDCDIIMICVNTPMIAKTGESYTAIVEKVIEQIRANLRGEIVICVRSTVPVGFSERMGTVAFCEYLTEANWQQDVLNTKEWIIGIDADRRDYIITLFESVAPAHIQRSYISTKECEMIKYMRNCFLATKVSFCNEIESFCRTKDIAYDTVREYATHDTRIGTSHTLVPGPDGKRGFALSCFPKDLASLKYQMDSVDGCKCSSAIISSVIHRNNTIDRPEQDWSQDKRAMI